MILKPPFHAVFDSLEFLLQHPKVSDGLRDDLGRAFEQGRSAYRIRGGEIIAVGSPETAAAVLSAIDQATDAAPAAASHLRRSGNLLSKGDWAGSVRESIHAVESVVRLLTDTGKLSDALDVLTRRGQLHGALRTGFAALYGYTSDEEGVRHASVFSPQAKVDEADAMFMLGACSSFVGYILSRSPKANG